MLSNYLFFINAGSWKQVLIELPLMSAFSVTTVDDNKEAAVSNSLPIFKSTGVIEESLELVFLIKSTTELSDNFPILPLFFSFSQKLGRTYLMQPKCKICISLLPLSFDFLILNLCS